MYVPDENWLEGDVLKLKQRGKAFLELLWHKYEHDCD